MHFLKSAPNFVFEFERGNFKFVIEYLYIIYFRIYSAIPGDMQAKEDCMIMFSVKDKDLITSELIGEAFLSFQRIAKGVSSGDIKDLEQIILPLSVKSHEDGIILF